MPFVHIRDDSLEYEYIPAAEITAPVIVFLHEGLGSLAMWGDFPRLVVEKTGHPALVYSRADYGRSTSITGRRGIDFMHREALDVLPDLLDELGIVEPILFGHSDGGSIALIFAGGTRRSLSGMILMAPHVMVESVCVDRIREVDRAFGDGELRAKLSRYHRDPDSAFRHWTEVWLDPEFLTWNIERYLPEVACPILAIQGENDEYGTMEQIHRLARLAPKVEALQLADCRHSPHRDQPQAVLRAVERFVRAVDATDGA